ncbi:LysE family transporter [Pseudoalteromonas ruthenica]|uniref:Lysine transporter LysE n=1 Tax=Pseudoalteromonas ruthenica TaxID=151081 RepID=A0A0F4PWG9_9GAMM|nr:LysE family transporter [Pseudoalteromonas ruthenica]KJY94648.1 lysine transporter LysE [Pseudoalteromonas ruthenica]KJY98636.1 lysine transporter LysE [Pseudoalteromonas ruthenica]TMO89961.1 lysine transporter LysE [Pseudoalteromonas ruthenica]TMO91364.1 lysine transporter LysE [Pseudoalteromonas ruthenica]TMP01657.1 lysine transporter LysE [Pseudoalteromonas ruthenica]
MSYWPEFLAIASAHFFAVASPGPDFAVVLRQSVRFGRDNALITSAGVGAGILVHIIYCLVGVALLISQAPDLFNLLKYMAAAYLAYMGIQALRHAKPGQVEQVHPTTTQPAESFIVAFRRGFLTNALNPKATLFFLSLFTLVISIDTPKWVQLGYGLYMALATWAWFSFLSIMLTRARVRTFFLAKGFWFDRAIGVVLLLLATQVVLL